MPDPITTPVAPPNPSTPPVVPPVGGLPNIQEAVNQALENKPVTAPVTPQPTSSPSAEEMPLAFAAPVKTEPVPESPAPVPPPPPAPLPSAPSPEPKQKTKGKILGVFLGILMLGAAAFGGYTYYVNNFGQEATIAEITDKSKCTGCSKPQDGGWLVWRDGQCKVVGTCNSSKDGQNTQNPTTPTPVPNVGNKEACEAAGKAAGTTYFWCAGCGGFCNTDGLKTCNVLQQEKCGEAISLGASCSKTPGGAFTNACDCDKNGTDDTWFDKTGYCNAKDAQGTVDPAYYDTWGLCAVAGSCEGTGTDPGTGAGAMYSCTNSGCSLTAAGIAAKWKIYKWHCDKTTDLSGGCQDGTPNIGNTQNFSANCGSEQIDVNNGSATVTFRSKIYAKACTTTITTPPPGGPTMACTGITRTPTTTPKIGDKLTFTCAGSVTPSTAGTLSYKFRYSFNNGAAVSLTNKTPTTAELAIAACGTYKVQCQACATLNGVLTCDPVWTGATQ